MRVFLLILLLGLSVNQLFAQKTIHVFVALCDNVNQGIVPVPAKLGNGEDADNNLYWGAAYGVRTYFKNSADWSLVQTIETKSEYIMERLIFKHKTKDVYLFAEAYKGAQIKNCVEQFALASNGQGKINYEVDGKNLAFYGEADLLCYVGHDGLMDFDISPVYKSNSNKKDVMILACFSKDFFSPHMRSANAEPILWTTHLMAPEAYTLKAAIDGWIIDESGLQIEERAAQAYNKYQKCGLKGARNLFATGY
jgi:hypothetical protein